MAFSAFGCVVLHMSNGTKDFAPQALHTKLTTIVEAYRGVLLSDERRLLEAMLEFERSCWAEWRRHAA